MLDRGRRQHSELTLAESTLQVLQTKLESLRTLLEEQKAERWKIDAEPHLMAATGDLNHFVRLKSRTVALDKSISELKRSEIQCQVRIESFKKYLFTLQRRLDSLRREESMLNAELSAENLPQNIKATLLSRISRVKLQIEAIAGKA